MKPFIFDCSHIDELYQDLAGICGFNAEVELKRILNIEFNTKLDQWFNEMITERHEQLMKAANAKNS